MKQLDTQYLSKPGDTIQETIDALSMSQRELAERLGYQASKLNQLIKGEISLTRDMAGKLEMVLGIDALFWLGLEQVYQEEQLRIEQQAQLRKNLTCLDSFPISTLKSLGVITVKRKGIDQLKELLQFFRIASFEEWEDIYKNGKTSVAFKLSLAQRNDAEAISSWLRYGEVQAERITLKPYNANQFKQMLGEARKLSIERPTDFTTLRDMCADCGVALALTPSFPKSATYGSTRWILGRQHPLIQISDRGKRADNCWFSFFHEAAHVLLHGKTEVFLEDIKDDFGIDGQKEKEANDFARKLLFGDFPLEHYRKIGEFFWDYEDLESMAIEYSIAPCILIGQLQRIGSLPHSVFREYIPKVDFRKLSATT